MDSTIKTWDIGSAHIDRTINTFSKCLDMHVSRSETYIASGHNDCSIKVWNAKTKDSIFKIPDAHSDPVSCVRITPDEKYIVSTSKDDTIKIWDLRKQKQLSMFEHDDFKLGSNNVRFCISPNSQYVVCGSKQGHVIWYDAKAGECVNIVKDQHKTQVVACEWQPKADKGVKMASVDDLGGLIVWSA